MTLFLKKCNCKITKDFYCTTQNGASVYAKLTYDIIFSSLTNFNKLRFIHKTETIFYFLNQVFTSIHKVFTAEDCLAESLFE